jgi:hypothetical protein
MRETGVCGGASLRPDGLAATDFNKQGAICGNRTVCACGEPVERVEGGALLPPPLWVTHVPVRVSADKHAAARTGRCHSVSLFSSLLHWIFLVVCRTQVKKYPRSQGGGLVPRLTRV